MKLLIDIPEHIYEHAKETTEDSRDEFDAMRAIANGTQPESRSEIPNTCGDVISRQAVIDRINKQREGLEPKIYPQDKIGDAAYRVCIEFINRIPSVTPQQRTGRWIDDDFGSKCSYCGFYTHLDKFDRPMKFKHCSMCGAKMEVEE